MPNHKEERHICWFWIEDSANGCEALDVQNCEKCTFFKTAEEFFAGREESWRKITESKKSKRIMKKYYNIETKN